MGTRAEGVYVEGARYIREVSEQIAKEYEFHVAAMEEMEGQVHVFIEAAPVYSPARLIQVLRSVSAQEVIEEFRMMSREMWSGKIWSGPYFIGSVGDKLTADVVRKYIRYQKREDNSGQPCMFEES